MCVVLYFTASRQASNDVSFSAYADEDGQFPQAGDVIRYPNVVTNNGGHYDPTESVFTCPVDGTYYFIYSLYAHDIRDGERAYANIYRDTADFSQVYCRNEGSDVAYLVCVNSVVITCNVGQRVSIAVPSAGSQVYGAAKRSTFSGFLIHLNT